MRANLLGLVSTTALCLAGSPALAQTTTAGAAAAADPTAIAEVIVTAQKREERLIDTPQSLSVVSGAEIGRLAATRFADFANTVPGLDFTTAGAGNTQITIRGVSTGYDISPTVGIYVDETPYGSSTTFAQASQLGLDVGLFDLSRVEVLRGPQGTLYGASTMGGLIKYVTNRPDASGFGGNLQAGVSATNHGGVNYNIAGTVNVPIKADLAALRASLFEDHDGGYIDNVALNRKDVNHGDIYGGRLDLLVTPTDRFSVRLTGFAQDVHRSGEATALFTAAGAPVYGKLEQFRLYSEPFRERFRLGSATVEYDFGPAKLTSITSYQTIRETNTWDVSAVYVPLLNSFGLGPFGATGVAVTNDTDKVTEELRLAGRPGETLEWIVGGFYTHESSEEDEIFLLRSPAGAPLPNNLLTYRNPSRYEETAGFGDLTWHVTSQLDATAGIRYAVNDQSSDQVGSGLLVTPAKSSSRQHVTTYLADVRYHFSPHAMAYARYATGYRPGGPDFSLRDPATGAPQGPTSFQSDKLESYELGLKAETSDRRYSLDLALYDIKWRNIQVAKIINGLEAVVNAPGGATLRGAELTLSARPSDGLAITGAFAVQDPKLNAAEPDLGAAKGERLPNSPRFTAAVNVDYDLPVAGDLRPTLGATLRHVGERTVSFNASPSQYRLPAYTNLDLRLGITVQEAMIQAYVHNLLDERGQLGNVIPSFGTRISIEQPRTIGMQVTRRF